jgi:hypothetical protein
VLPLRQHAITREHRRTLLLSARTTTVYIHVASSGRNCRETIATLRNARVTHHDVTKYSLCRLSRQWLRRQRYHVLARIICECRYAKRAGEDPYCKSDRPAAPATQSGSSYHVVILSCLRNLSKPIPQPTWYFTTSPLPAAYARNALVRPKKMFQANVVQSRSCFFTTAATGCDELIIDRDGRFPLRVFLQ